MERSSFFNSVGGDRKYDAADWAEYFASFISNGVFGTPANCLQAVPDGSMNVALLPGSAWINGYFYVNGARNTLALDIADGVLKRIDRVVIQWSLADRRISAKIKKGVSATNPTAPVLQRDASVYELCVAEITVNAGATSIAEGNIVDRRADNALCGTVSSVVSEAHSHDLNDLVGPLGIAKGGTGATTAAAARNALGLGNTTGAVPVANGGTGATTAVGARTNLGITPEGIAAAPTVHTSADSTYGTATDALYGHAKASATAPKAHGTAAAGTEVNAFARGDHVHPAQTAISGNAATATKLQTARTLSLSGGATGSVSFDGGANADIAVTALDVGKANAGTLPVARGGTGAADAAGARTALGITLGNLGAAAASHTHDLGGQTGTVPVAKGGTGATDSATARTNLGVTLANLGAAASSHTHPSSQISDTVPVSKGGTGATDAATARTNLGVTLGNLGAAASSHTHPSSQISDTVPVSKGGTGATTAAAARNALGLGNTTGALPVANGGTGAADAAGARNALGLGNTSGALPLANGGTGATSAAAARNNLGLGNTTGALPVANGGTGATTAKAALTALGIIYAASLPSSGTDGQICLVPV